jgi:site-specific DNA recombinase
MIRYLIYCRKSSEEEERQALSIDSQLQELREFAVRNQLNIVNEFIESKSARKPNNRPVFDQMLSEIKEGKADGILSWAPDRISRNAIEGGKIINLVDPGVVKDLKFPSLHFESGPHGLLNLSLAFSFGKLYVDNLSESVKRGNREKIRRGEFPGPAPLGYVNNFKKKNIEADPESFNLIKSIFEDYAEAKLSFPDIVSKLFEAGIKTRSGNKIHYTTIQRMLTNPFYYGVFRLKGELYPGSHPAMISKALYDKVQKQLEAKYRPVNWTEERKSTKGFLFSELGKCGECGYSIVNDYHCKKSGREFRYYRCSKKSKTCKCSERAINENDLAPQIESLASEIAIDDRLYSWCLDEIKTWKDEEEGNLDLELTDLNKNLEVNKAKLEKLLDIHIEGGINSEEYTSKKNKIVNESAQIKGQIQEISQKGSAWFEPVAEALKTSNEAHHKISARDFTGMYQVLKKTGSNRVLANQTYSLDFTKPFIFFREVLMLTEKCSSPKKINLNKNLKTKLESGVYGNEKSVSFSDAVTPLTTNREAVSGASSPKGCELAHVGYVPEHAVKWRTERDSNFR